jgi:hypothetical protein
MKGLLCCVVPYRRLFVSGSRLVYGLTTHVRLFFCVCHSALFVRLSVYFTPCQPRMSPFVCAGEDVDADGAVSTGQLLYSARRGAASVGGGAGGGDGGNNLTRSAAMRAVQLAEVGV